MAACTCGVGGEQRAEVRADEQEEHPERDADDHPPAQHEARRVAGAVDLAGAERLAGDGLGRDGEGVEGEGEEGPDRRGHLVGRERHVTEPGGDPGRHEQDGPQGQGADEERDASAGCGEHPARVGAQRHRRAGGVPDEDDDERARHARSAR